MEFVLLRWYWGLKIFLVKIELLWLVGKMKRNYKKNLVDIYYLSKLFGGIEFIYCFILCI